VGERVQALVDKLERGEQKSRTIFGQLPAEQWEAIVYAEPVPWRLRDLLAHFVSSEVELLHLAQDVASGGPGAPGGYDYDAFNASEQARLSSRSVEDLMSALGEARQATLAWLRTLPEEALDHLGRHPALGEVSLETLVLAIYGHQLMHMRDVQRLWTQATAAEGAS